jgi:tetratricopeptide (TPR) repeat protein
MQRFYTCSLIFLFLSSGIFAQNKMNTSKWRKTERDSMERAYLLYEEGNYTIAIPIFEALLKSHPDELYLKYMNGLCGLYRSDKHGDALVFLSEVYEKNKKTSDIEFDLAKANHLNYKFDEALRLIDLYKAKNKTIKPATQKQLQLLVDYCNNGKKLVANPLPATITNIGTPVNSEASEYVPVISSDESVMLYTYVGKKSRGGLQNAFNQADPYGIYYEDVFITYKDSTGHFGEPKEVGPAINSTLNDAAVALAPDGQKLFIYKDDGNNGGDLYMSSLIGSDWSVPERLTGDINSSYWEGSCSLSGDGKTLYFASERPGGYGGRDIYYSKLQSDGTWGTAVNMGDKINTFYDDDSPFIHPDNRILLYSSQGKNSMGGHDIFRTLHNLADSSWSDPENMGYPVNSPDDDKYFILTADGKTGYYSSGKVEGHGLQDIYRISPGLIGLTPYVALLKGTVTLDGVPLGAKVRVDVKGKSMNYASLISNATNGKYLVNLPAGDTYRIIYSHEGQPDQEQTLDLSSLNQYSEKVIDIAFSTGKKDTVKTVTAADPVIQPKNDPPPVVTNGERTGSEETAGLIFKVQIAAYRAPENYVYEKLKGLGKVEKMDLDGIMRFTIGGEFKTLNSAVEHCTKVKNAGQSDAFITAIYNGKRVYLDELEKMGLIPPQKK